MAETPTKPAKGQGRQAPPEVTPERAEELAEERLTTSSDARFSKYRPATDDELDLADEVLPPGPHVMQERGEPDEGADAGFKFEGKKR